MSLYTLISLEDMRRHQAYLIFSAIGKVRVRTEHWGIFTGHRVFN